MAACVCEQDVQPKGGRLLLFHNCYEGSCSVHPDSLHSGKPVIAGEKCAVAAAPPSSAESTTRQIMGVVS